MDKDFLGGFAVTIIGGVLIGFISNKLFGVYSLIPILILAPIWGWNAKRIYERLFNNN